MTEVLAAPPSATNEAPAGRVGNYRWVVCALLFFATTVNYIDRQILALIKEFLDAELGWSNETFGWVNGAFQLAYAVGLLVFGWFVDRFGTKIGYAVSIVALEPVRDRPRLRRLGQRLLCRTARAGLQRGRQLPLRDQGGGALVPEARARLRDRHLQRRDQRGRDHRADDDPGDRVHLRLALDLRPGRPRRLRLAASSGSRCTTCPRSAKKLTRAEYELIHSDKDEGAAGGKPMGWSRALRLPPDLVLPDREVPDRPRLVVLPDLAARLLQGDARARHQALLGAPGHDLRDRDRALASPAAG